MIRLTNTKPGLTHNTTLPTTQPTTKSTP
jgi:hypothetical protein